MRSFSCAFVVLLACAGAARAASQADWDDCKQFSDKDRTVAGCTRVLQDPAESASNRAIAHRNRGIAYDTLGAHDRAIADFDEAIRLDRKFAAAHYSRGIMYAKKRDYDRAIAAYSEAIRLDPQFAFAYSRRGHVYLDKKDYDRAIADYSKAIQLDPKAAITHANRGNAYYRKKDYDRAAADYEQAVKLDPGNADFRTSRDTVLQARRAAALPARAQRARPPEFKHYLLNLTPVRFDVIDNGRTVCTLAPDQSCWWPALDGRHEIELRRPDGRSISTTVSVRSNEGSGVLHRAVCPRDFGTAERSDAPVCN